MANLSLAWHTHVCLAKSRIWGPPIKPQLQPRYPASSSLIWEGKGFLGPFPFSYYPSIPVSLQQTLGGIPDLGPRALTAWVLCQGALGPLLSSVPSLFPSTRHRGLVLSRQGPEARVWRGWQPADWLAGCRGCEKGRILQGGHG